MRYCNQVEPLAISSGEFRCMNSQMLVRYEVEDESDGGIALPDLDSWWAHVYRVGPDCVVQVGDRVYMQAHRGENINLSDGEFTMVDEAHALLVDYESRTETK